MAGEVEAAKAAADAAKSIVSAEPVMGSLLILALVGIAGLALYVRSVHNAWGLEREKWQAQLSDVQEKRLAENRASLLSQADATAVLSKVTETLQGMARSMESIGSGLRDSAAKQEATGASIKEAAVRIEADISALSGKIDRPLVQTPQGFSRASGGVP